MPGFLGRKFPAPVGMSIELLLRSPPPTKDQIANDSQLSPCGLSTSLVRRATLFGPNKIWGNYTVWHWKELENVEK